MGPPHCDVEERTGHSDAALHRHQASEQQRSQAKESHRNSKKVTQRLVRVKCFPVVLWGVYVEGQRAIDQVSQEVSHHQTTSKHEEGCFRLPSEPVVGFDQDEEGQSVGNDAHCHRDGSWGHRNFLFGTAPITHITRHQASSISWTIIKHDRHFTLQTNSILVMSVVLNKLIRTVDCHYLQYRIPSVQLQCSQCSQTPKLNRMCNFCSVFISTCMWTFFNCS